MPDGSSLKWWDQSRLSIFGPVKIRQSEPLPLQRLLFLVLAFVSVMAGLNAALVRLGALAPVASTELGAIHGVLMIYGFLGTAIGLERAVSLQADRRRLWPYAAPLLAGLGGISATLCAALPRLSSVLAERGIGSRLLPGSLWLASMLVLLSIYTYIMVRRQPSMSALLQILSAFVGASGIALWMKGYEPGAVVPWWLMFLVLTIISERLELARITFAGAGVEFRVLCEGVAVVAALPVTLVAPSLGFVLLGAALAVMVIDVAWHDVARRLVGTAGVPGFAATCMLGGYLWALLSAGMWVFTEPSLSGYHYDIAVHGLTIGFTLSMIVAHAPVIIPAVIRREVPYHPVMWFAWALIQSALVLRLFGAGRAAEFVWRFGGSLGVVAFLVFVVSTATLTIRLARRRQRQRRESLSSAQSEVAQ